MFFLKKMYRYKNDTEIQFAYLIFESIDSHNNQ